MLNKLSRAARSTPQSMLFTFAIATFILVAGVLADSPITDFHPQGPMQADLNAGGHNLTNAATITATNTVSAPSGNFSGSVTVNGSAVTAIDNDGTMTANSSSRVPTQEAVVNYVAASSGGGGGSSGWTLIDSSGSAFLSSASLTGGRYLVDLGSIAASGSSVTLDSSPTDDETVAIRDLNFGAGNGFGGTYGALNIAYTSNSITPDGAGGTTVYYTALTTAGETATFVWSAALDTWVEHQVMPASGYVAPTWTPVNSGDFIQLNPGGFYAVTAATGDGAYGPQPGVNVGDTIYIWDAANCLAAQGTDFDSVGGSDCAVFQNGAEANASSYPPVAFGTVPPYPVYKLIWDGTEWIQYLDGTNNP